MSLEPEWLFVAVVLLGQVGISIVVVNVVHGLGLSDRQLDTFHRSVVGAFLALTGLIVGHALAGPWTSWPWLLRGHASACLATALVGWPFFTMLRMFRRHPVEVTGNFAEVDLAATAGGEALIGSGRHSWMLRLPGNESFRLQKKEWEIAIPNLPREWDGLSLVHLSDLHFSHCFKRQFFENVIDDVSAWETDLVVFTGDLIDHDDTLDWIVPVMSRLRGRLGKYAILGNHDCSHHPRKIRRAIKSAGFIDLDGRWTRLEIDGSHLAIGGTSYPWGPGLDPRAMPEADFRLMLSHTPDRFATAAEWGVDLVLSGHNHAGQIRLPMIGPVFMPSIYSRRFDRGFFRSGRTLMYVNQGVAGKHPIRYGGCLPEVTRFVLRVARTTAVSRPSVHPGGAETAFSLLDPARRPGD